MLLPPELLTLFFLATATTALPQNTPQTNTTASPLEPTVDSTDPGHQDLRPTEINIPAGDDPCPTSSCGAPNFIPGLPTASGWEDDTNNLMPTVLKPPEQSDRVVTTRRPTIINIQTSTAQTMTQAPPSNGEPEGRKNSESEGKPAQPTGSLAPPPQQTAKDNLLSNIVSQLGDATHAARPTPVLPPVTGGGAHSAQRQHAPVTQGTVPLGSADAASPQTTIAPGGVVTIGTATLVLTPGLSTTIGSAADTTFVGITTDITGHTIITISSSGTAVTATVTDADATVTLPRTGFDASITDVARPGALSTSRSAGAAAPSSSKGAAVERFSEVGWWIGILGAMFVI